MEEKEKVKGKMVNIQYSDLSLQEYLATQEITTQKKKLLFLLRTRMLNLPNNFGQKNVCELCTEEGQNQVIENQEHLLVCTGIKAELRDLQDNTTIKYEHIFDRDIYKQKAAANLIHKAIQTRKKIMSASPSAPELSAV